MPKRRTWACFFGRHRWTAWRHWSDDRPVIVRSSLECMNDPTVVRECVVCGAYLSANPYKTTGVPVVHARNLVG